MSLKHLTDKLGSEYSVTRIDNKYAVENGENYSYNRSFNIGSLSGLFKEIYADNLENLIAKDSPFLLNVDKDEKE